jgi:hypothetical protein
MRQRHYEGVVFPVRQQTVNVIVVDRKTHSGALSFSTNRRMLTQNSDRQTRKKRDETILTTNSARSM